LQRGTPRVATPRQRNNAAKRSAGRPEIRRGPGAKSRVTDRDNIRRGRENTRQRAAEQRRELTEQRRQRALERRQSAGKGRDNIRDNIRDGDKKGPGRTVGRRTDDDGRDRALVRRGKGDRSLMLRNRGLAERSARTRADRALARATFGGRYANRFHDRDGRHRGDRRHWRRHHHGHIHVIGWVGPLFWPYAYSDFVDYAFWPYAYDAFWPYAYDDVYEGFFGPYAVGGPVYYADASSAAPRGGGSGRRAARSTSGGGVPAAQICTGETTGLTDWPIERIAEAVNPDDSQRALLNELRGAAERAVSLLQSACPTELPSTPSGRMAAMRQRLETMREAVQIVRPALDRFYASLSDEQKAGFNTLEPEQAAAARAQKTELSQACSTAVAKTHAAPTARIKQALRPSPEQQTALDNLEAATAKAAEILTANCPTEESLTPPGRLAAMEVRLDAMLKALDVVQPALAEFYDSLSDEQKARFNQLGVRQQASR
jgi:hypothetical protein